MDIQATHCPYCGGAMLEGVYSWREIEISGAGKLPGTYTRLRAIEIYCSRCHSTLSLTPISE